MNVFETISNKVINLYIVNNSDPISIVYLSQCSKYFRNMISNLYNWQEISEKEIKFCGKIVENCKFNDPISYFYLYKSFKFITPARDFSDIAHVNTHFVEFVEDRNSIFSEKLHLNFVWWYAFVYDAVNLPTGDYDVYCRVYFEKVIPFLESKVSFSNYPLHDVIDRHTNFKTKQWYLLKVSSIEKPLPHNDEYFGTIRLRIQNIDGYIKEGINVDYLHIVPKNQTVSMISNISQYNDI
ncbi:hypothetical protein DLAC_04369 [Tieghemostelium lacteum]|uniref:F-box domain-containing protein n=1 Tax=Tieghemostelium lacteum TaxID=361077 RepID=A0A151ZJK9_TIELA|nr:hypothetical protein DLAC_04369 [Tieghemostelium lacteum]|eukprot:KYQ94089.1 hypothetical protein DLAC_04369 [Tieghemostelium lacteum]